MKVFLVKALIVKKSHKLCPTVIFNFLYIDSHLGYWYIIWKVNIRNTGMNLRNTLFALICLWVGISCMQSQWPRGKWIDKGCCLVIICGTWRSKRGFLNLSYRGKGKSHKQEELLWGAIKKLPKELTTELLYLELPTILASCGVKRYMHYIRFLLTKTS